MNQKEQFAYYEKCAEKISNVLSDILNNSTFESGKHKTAFIFSLLTSIVYQCSTHCGNQAEQFVDDLFRDTKKTIAVMNKLTEEQIDAVNKECESELNKDAEC